MGHGTLLHRTSGHRQGRRTVAVRSAPRRLKLVDLRMVQIEGRGFTAYPGQPREVVPWWWARGGPLQGASVSPRVVNLDLFPYLAVFQML